MTETLKLYDGTELQAGDEVVFTLRGKGDTQAMTVSDVHDEWTGDVKLNGDWVGEFGTNPAKMSADMDHVATLRIGHQDERTVIEAVEVC